MIFGAPTRIPPTLESRFLWRGSPPVASRSSMTGFSMKLYIRLFAGSALEIFPPMKSQQIEHWGDPMKFVLAATNHKNINIPQRLRPKGD